MLSVLFKQQHAGCLRLQSLMVEEVTAAVQKACLRMSGCSDAGVRGCSQEPLPMVPPCLEELSRAGMGAVSRVCYGHTYRVAQVRA